MLMLHCMLSCIPMLSTVTMNITVQQLQWRAEDDLWSVGVYWKVGQGNPNSSVTPGSGESPQTHSLLGLNRVRHFCGQGYILLIKGKPFCHFWKLIMHIAQS